MTTMFNSFEAHSQQPQEFTPIGAAGNSHLGWCNEACNDPGWHVTTNIPGFGKAEGLDNGLRIHDYLKDFNY
jgi:hypothetical protein